LNFQFSIFTLPAPSIEITHRPRLHVASRDAATRLRCLISIFNLQFSIPDSPHANPQLKSRITSACPCRFTRCEDTLAMPDFNFQFSIPRPPTLN
jgi:hypothetical protein